MQARRQRFLSLCEHRKQQASGEQRSHSYWNWGFPLALVLILSFTVLPSQADSETWGFMGGQEISTAPTNSGFFIKGTTALAPSDVSRIADALLYEVKQGDSLSSIAAEYGISVATIKNVNRLYTDTVNPGQTLTIIPVDGVLHQVGIGETITSIANRYKIEANDILTQNKLEEGQRLAGLTLIIPGGEPLAPVPTRTGSPAPRYTVTQIYQDSTPVAGQLLRPATGVYTQYFHWGHAAVDIADPTEPPIYASASATVIEAHDSGWNGGYGKTVLLDHGDGIITRYAHMSKLYVAEGDEVSAGQAIGKMGSTGRSSGTHLHFEVIDNGTKKNPLAYF